MLLPTVRISNGAVGGDGTAETNIFFILYAVVKFVYVINLFGITLIFTNKPSELNIPTPT